MSTPAPVPAEPVTVARRAYEPPRLTVYGAATVLTKDPQSRPSALSGSGDAVRILFLGDNA